MSCKHVSLCLFVALIANAGCRVARPVTAHIKDIEVPPAEKFGDAPSYRLGRGVTMMAGAGGLDASFPGNNCLVDYNIDEIVGKAAPAASGGAKLLLNEDSSVPAAPEGVGASFAEAVSVSNAGDSISSDPIQFASEDGAALHEPSAWSKPAILNMDSPKVQWSLYRTATGVQAAIESTMSSNLGLKIVSVDVKMQQEYKAELATSYRGFVLDSSQKEKLLTINSPVIRRLYKNDEMFATRDGANWTIDPEKFFAKCGKSFVKGVVTGRRFVASVGIDAQSFGASALVAVDTEAGLGRMTKVIASGKSKTSLKASMKALTKSTKLDLSIFAIGAGASVLKDTVEITPPAEGGDQDFEGLIVKKALSVLSQTNPADTVISSVVSEWPTTFYVEDPNHEGHYLMINGERVTAQFAAHDAKAEQLRTSATKVFQELRRASNLVRLAYKDSDGSSVLMERVAAFDKALDAKIASCFEAPTTLSCDLKGLAGGEIYEEAAKLDQEHRAKPSFTKVELTNGDVATVLEPLLTQNAKGEAEFYAALDNAGSGSATLNDDCWLLQDAQKATSYLQKDGPERQIGEAAKFLTDNYLKLKPAMDRMNKGSRNLTCYSRAVIAELVRCSRQLDMNCPAIK